jgi:hypothetical protein
MGAINWQSKAEADAAAAEVMAQRQAVERADDELYAAIDSVDTSKIQDPAAATAIEALKDAMLGRTRAGESPS